MYRCLPVGHIIWSGDCVALWNTLVPCATYVQMHHIMKVFFCQESLPGSVCSVLKLHRDRIGPHSNSAQQLPSALCETTYISTVMLYTHSTVPYSTDCLYAYGDSVSPSVLVVTDAVISRCRSRTIGHVSEFSSLNHAEMVAYSQADGAQLRACNDDNSCLSAW